MTKSEKSPKKKNFCEFCNKTVIGSAYKFKSHLFKHNAVKARFKCNFCSKEYYRSDTYTRHLRSHTGEKNQKRFICDYCDRGFVNKYNLIAHLKNIHDDSINSDYVKFTCKACSISFCEKRILHNHIRKCHFNIDIDDGPTHFDKNLNERWVEKVVSTDACVEMTKINNNVITIKKCYKIDVPVTKKKVRTKTTYGAEFVDQYSRATCDYCKKEMVKKSLKNHIRERHLNIRKYNCLECDRSFKRHYQLVDHKCGPNEKKRINRKIVLGKK